MKKIVTKTNISLLIIALCAILFYGLFIISNLALNKVPVVHAESSATLKGSSVEDYTVKNVWWSLIDYQIENLIITNKQQPQNYIGEPVDVSEEQNGTLHAYKIDNGNDTYNCVIYANVDKIYAPQLSNRLFSGENGSYELNNLHNVKSIVFENNCFDTSNSTDLYGMFGTLKSITNLDLSCFDTSNAIAFTCMFKNCWNLQSLDISHFNVSQATGISQMFQNCIKLSELNISSKKLSDNPEIYSWDTSNVEVMNSTFAGCASLKEINLSHFNTSKVYDMNGMFGGCCSLEKLNISSFELNALNDSNSFGFLGIGDQLLMTQMGSQLPEGTTLDEYINQNIASSDRQTQSMSEMMLLYRSPKLKEFYTPKVFGEKVIYIPIDNEPLYVNGDTSKSLTTEITSPMNATMYKVTSAEENTILKTLSSETPNTGFLDNQLFTMFFVSIISIASIVVIFKFNKKEC